MHKLWVLVAVQATVAAASLVVEIVAGRMLAPYVGMSLYTWTSVIAVVLAGFSVGHWVGGRLAEWPADRALRANGWAMIAAAVTTAGAVFLLRGVAGPVITVLEDPVAAIVALTMLVFFLPSFFAGIPAPILSQIAVQRNPAQSGRALGAMFAAGAWGAIIGTLAAGFVFISWLGSVGTLTFVTVVYVAVAVYSFLAANGARGWLMQGAVAALVPLALAGAALWRPDPCTRESDYFCIRVVDISPSEAEPVRLMVLDHLVHGISDGLDASAMLTPHGMMQDGLSRMRMAGRDSWDGFIIGGGTYTVPRAWVEMGEPVRVTVAEVDPMVTEVAAESFWFDPDSVRVVHADARIVLTREDTTYDVILGDAFTDIAAPPHLITREFFELAASRLNPDGAFLMTIIDHLDRLDVLASLTVTARKVFPEVEIWADPSHDVTQARRVFLMVAGETRSPVSEIRHDGPEPRRAVRVAEASLQQIVETRRAIVLTDDFAPIDRLLGTGG
ncbi:MAG: spermidine synthase [Rhodobacteraceae bacterium]|nr:MAG: spermidine synthase [Paracoccaceae bacterium]